METKGHIINDTIARIEEPSSVSLSGQANFINFTAKKEGTASTATITLTIDNQLIDTANEETIRTESGITFTDVAGQTDYEFYGTKDQRRVSDKIFYISDDKNITTQNIRQCLMQNTFLNSNYTISIPFKEGNYINQIEVKALEPQRPQPLTAKSAEATFAIVKDKINASTNDSIFNGADSASIELEVYTLQADEAFLGQNKLPEKSMGNYMTTLSKSYFGEPLWFNLNTLMNNKAHYTNDFITATSWCNTGTANAYRIVARRYDGRNREPFYISAPLYNITGYDHVLSEDDLSKYVLSMQDSYPEVHPLTKQPILPQLKGQTQFFNFILSDEEHGKGGNILLGLQYRFYTQSGSYMGATDMHEMDKNSFATVNTIRLDIDGALDKLRKANSTEQRTAGLVKIYLIRNKSHVSLPLTFRMQPSHLYRLNDFAFLNSVGGWSSFSFGGTSKSEFSTSTDTILKTHTPGLNIHFDLESVFDKEQKESFSAETLPIDKQTAEWLKEMSASPAVYELSTGRYIIVEDMKISTNSKDDLFRVEMKYRY